MNTIILDRDGVINHDSDNYIKNPNEWIPIPGSLEAIAKLTKAGYKIFVATNQSGLARGLFDLDTLNAIHTKMQSAILELGGKLDGIYYCPHHPDEDCACRKPNTGMLIQMRDDQGVDLSKTIFVGDSLKDLKVASAVSAKPILVLTGKGARTASELEDGHEIEIYKDLAECVNAILTKPVKL